MNRTKAFYAVAVALVVGGAVLLLRLRPDAEPAGVPRPQPRQPVVDERPAVLGALREGLVGLWDFDDGHGTRLQDTSGRRHDGIVVGELAFGAPGVRTRSASLDGRTAWALVPDARDLRPAHFTVAVWFNPSRELTQAATLVVKPQRPAVWVQPFLSWMIRVNSPTLIEASVGSTGGYLNAAGVFTVPPLEPGRWRHAVLTFDGAQVSFFLDGERVGMRPFAEPIAYSELPIVVGADFGASPAADFFPGKLDQLALWERPLSGQEVRLLFNGGEGQPLP